MRPEDYVGQETLRRMQQTKWWMLARFLDQLLYNGSVVLTEGYPQQIVHHPKDKDKLTHNRKFMVGTPIYVGEFPEYLTCLGRDGKQFDVEKTLRELMHECERMAMKEVT